MKVKIVNWNNGREVWFGLVWLAAGDGIHRWPLFNTAAAAAAKRRKRSVTARQ